MINEELLNKVLAENTSGKDLLSVANKVFKGERISFDEGVMLYDYGDLGFLGLLANHIREQKHGFNTYFNRNYHIEPTNLCVFDCKFCSYSRAFSQKEDSWTMTEQEMLDKVQKNKDLGYSEVHIVGGVHPKLSLDFFCGLLKQIKAIQPEIHVKAMTAVEYDYMFKKAKVSIQQGLELMIDAGLDSIPGGGAEIFYQDIRKEICPDKVGTDRWLEIHEEAHKLGIHSNATMLYGHIEDYSHRIDHMDRLRSLQDKTRMFNAFIPLKFRNSNNQMSDILETTLIEDMRNYAISRIYLDNFKHIKAYWPMIGRSNSQLSLSFGVDDIDGTIDDTTKIYSLAGAEEQHPSMSTKQLITLINQGGKIAVERDSNYNIVKRHKRKEEKSDKKFSKTIPIR